MAAASRRTGRDRHAGEHMTWRRGAALLVALLLVTLATPTIAGAKPKPTSTTTASPTTTTAGLKQLKKPKLTTWQQAVSQRPTSGLLSKQAALELFALSFGSVPGVRVAKRHAVVQSATPAIEAVMAHFAEYTPKQQQAITRLIKGGADVQTAEIPPATPAASPAAPAAPTAAGGPTRATFVAAPAQISTTLPQLVTMAQQLRTTFAQRLGFDLPVPIRLHMRANLTGNPAARAEQLGEAPGLAWTVPDVGLFGYRACDITVIPGAAEISGYTTQYTLAHEVFHCFQDYVTGGATKAAWIMEGSAEYAASVAVPGVTSDWWSVYLTSPGTNLFTRSYDALGFYAHLAEVGIDPFRVIATMLRATSNEAAYASSGATATNFADTWASSLFREPARGLAWTTNGPGMPPIRGIPVTITVASDGSQDEIVDAAPYANATNNVRIDADLLQVAAGGSVRLSDGSVDTVVQGTQEFCTRSGGCNCPGSGHSQNPVQIKHDAVLAVSGGTTGSQATLTGVNLAKACCADSAPTATLQGLSITPTVNCNTIGLHIEKDGGLKLQIDYGLLVDHPRIVPRMSKGKVTSLELQGVTGFQLTFGAGVANYRSDNARFQGKVPIEVEVPVQPPTRGLPPSMKVTWSIDIRTAIAGDTSTLVSQGQYALSGPLGPQRKLAFGKTLSTVSSLISNISGVALAPSGIIIAVQTKFSAGTGTPAALKNTYTALNTSSSVTNGSILGAAVGVCRGVTLDIDATSGGGRAPGTNAKVFHKVSNFILQNGQLVDTKKICKGGP